MGLFTKEQLRRNGASGACRPLYTFLRPNSFMQNLVNYSSYTIADHGAFYAPMGDGRVSFIDARDIANVTYHVLTEEGNENKAYTIYLVEHNLVGII